MTAPTIKVEIGFEATATLGSNFVLDDSVKGVLNNTTYTLAGVVYVDVTQWCSGPINTDRGRSREVDQYQAGTLSFTLRNEDRRFDPSNTASPYYPGILPRVRVNAYLAGVQIFGGYVDDLDVQYEKPNICTVLVNCIDGFTVLANATIPAPTFSQQLTGARVSAVLDNTFVSFPATRNIAVGRSTLQSSTPTNVNALDHLQTVARSENGYLFCARDGTLTFLDRYAAGAVGSVSLGLGVLNPPSAGIPSFTDDGSGIPYMGITQKSQALLLYNQVLGTKTGGAPQSAADTASQAQYLIRTLSLGQLENQLDSDVLILCQYLIGRYSQPDVRFDQVVIELQNSSITAARLNQLASLDLTQLVMVTRTPGGTGTPSVITKNEIVDGIAFSFDVSSSTYRMTLRLSSYDSRKFFVLDDTTFGILDSSKLNY